MKKAIVIGIVIVFTGLMYQYPHAMLNPGELTEGHQKLKDNCTACHNPFWGISNEKCISCHKLSEIGKDKLISDKNDSSNEKLLFHQHLSNQKCTSCHTDHMRLNSDLTLSGFNHELLPVNIINNCSSCHDQHSDNLHKQLTGDCSSCHNTNGWKSHVKFNHDFINGDFKNNCVSCHENPDDSFHQQLKDNCDKCHSTGKWKPSTFDHSAYFQLDRDHNAKCNTCHVNNNYGTYTCYGCHEHSESKMTEEHKEQGINNLSDCVSCHKSGNEHDIRMNGNSIQDLNRKELNEKEKNNKSRENDKRKEHDNEMEDDE